MRQTIISSEKQGEKPVVVPLNPSTSSMSDEHPQKLFLPDDSAQSNLRFHSGTERLSLAVLVGSWPAIYARSRLLSSYNLGRFELALADRGDGSMEMI